ncbi:ABC transporter permease subunit [Lentisphaera profundi]|uniref:ABC transporter permease subunit n=1 Tax=Lentisphaera profundi TaxID=1658616 RepID=A0ABY7VY65_9BACT|nr:ABC transporter permease subunit [Lentisphaera profundi]WDE99185.1 ABC transporter permease subunit [Lentisphaera profundi]
MKQKLINFFELTGLTWFIPIVRLCTGDDPKEQMGDLFRQIALPLAAIVSFFMIWSYSSTKIKTSVGQLPGPSYVLSQAKAMWATHKTEKFNKDEFITNENFRKELAGLIEQRQQTSMSETKKVLTSKINSLKSVIGKHLSKLSNEIKVNQAIVEKAEGDKKASVATLTTQLKTMKKFVYDDNKELVMDLDGKPKLSDESLSKLANINNRRVAVYEGNLARIYKSSENTALALIKKIEKIDKYYQQDLIYQNDPKKAELEKKISSNKKKLDAFEKQIFKGKEYNSNGSIVDYIKLSIITVLFGFFLAAFIAIPIGILCGLSPSIMTALNPLIQTFRPVSPLAWVLITIQIIDGIFVGDNALTGDIVKNTFLHSGITVALCAMWATLSNTALGVSSVDPDHMNVAKVLKLSWFDRIFKIIIPSAIPYIFTGLRITLGVGWMVLIVSEMMATSRGLGWYIDQEYQNNKVESLANIIVCIFIIGFIGAVLDRIMSIFQKLVSFNDDVAA